MSWILPSLSWNYETKARPRDAMVGVRLLQVESSWSRNVPDSEVRSQSGVEPLHLAEPTFLPPPYQEVWSTRIQASPFTLPQIRRFVGPERSRWQATQGDAGTAGGAKGDHARPRPAVSKRKLTSKLASRASMNLAAGVSCRCSTRGASRGVARSSCRSDASKERGRMPKPLVSGLGSWRHGRAAATTSSLSARCRVLDDPESIPASDGCGESRLDWMDGHNWHIQVDPGGKEYRHRTA